MNEIKISVVSAAVMELPGGLRKLLDEPAFESNLMLASRRILFPVTTKFLEALCVRDLIGDDK